jgi:hypothetical protein
VILPWELNRLQHGDGNTSRLPFFEDWVLLLSAMLVIFADDAY